VWDNFLDAKDVDKDRFELLLPMMKADLVNHYHLIDQDGTITPLDPVGDLGGYTLQDMHTLYANIDRRAGGQDFLKETEANVDIVKAELARGEYPKGKLPEVRKWYKRTQLYTNIAFLVCVCKGQF
jgi:hypothetical protein